MNNEKTLFEKLGQSIYERYTKNTFSRVLKSEIDIIVFHTFLLKNLADEKLSDESILYDTISKDDIFKLSLISGLPESNIQSKIESDFYNYRDKDKITFDIQAFIEKQLINTKLGSNEFLKDGKIRIVVANPVIKKIVINELVSQGSIPDFSFNRDIMSIGIFDVLELLNKKNADTNKNVIDAIDEYLKLNEANEVKEQIENSNASSPKQRCMKILEYLGKTAYEKTLEAVFAAMFKVQ